MVTVFFKLLGDRFQEMAHAGVVQGRDEGADYRLCGN
jgi:hypothetical protein